MCHIIAFLQRLEAGSHGMGPSPTDSVLLIHPHRTTKSLQKQYEIVPMPVDYSEIEKSELLPGPASIRAGRPREQHFACGYCGIEGHNKLTCEKLKRHCSPCELKVNNYLTCKTAFFRPVHSSKEFYYQRQVSLRRQMTSALNASQRRQARHTRADGSTANAIDGDGVINNVDLLDWAVGEGHILLDSPLPIIDEVRNVSGHDQRTDSNNADTFADMCSSAAEAAEVADNTFSMIQNK